HRLSDEKNKSPRDIREYSSRGKAWSAIQRNSFILLRTLHCIPVTLDQVELWARRMLRWLTFMATCSRDACVASCNPRSPHGAPQAARLEGEATIQDLHRRKQALTWNPPERTGRTAAPHATTTPARSELALCSRTRVGS